MNVTTDDNEKEQTSQEETNVISIHPLGWSWRDHLKMLVGWIVFFLTVNQILSCNLKMRPGYGEDARMREAFCVEWNERVSSIYYWDGSTFECRVLEED